MARGRRSLISLLSLFVTAATLVAGSSATAAGDDSPSVRLIAPLSSMTVRRTEGYPAYIDPGVLMASARGAWDIRAVRPFGDEARAWQFVDGSAGRQLPTGMLDDLRGLAGFFRVTMTDEQGDVVVQRSRRFCPGSSDVRINGQGPLLATYPRNCWMSPFARGTVWGIDHGWATSAFGWGGMKFHGPDGDYTLRLHIAPAFQRFFAVAEGDGRVSVQIRIKTTEGGGDCPDCPIPKPPQSRTTGYPVNGPLGFRPTVVDPAAGTLPDLAALPAFSISLEQRGSRERIAFAATVWNAGPAPMLVEGFRRGEAEVMDAYQYFFDGPEVTGRARVGEMVYHRKQGHFHWHFLQFARYSLLDANLQPIGISKKQSFCLVPTDAIDLTVPGAEWRPGEGGLGTSCGSGPTDQWIRETLQAGWGDTYFQVAGQSLDVTGLPNGIYHLATEANPDGLLYEESMDNNLELRKIRLGGSPGERTLTVFPWHGMDI